MAYREIPSNEDLNRMLSEANREKKASAKRVKELEAKLTSISTTVQDHEECKVTHIDVSGMTPKELANMLTERSKLVQHMGSTHGERQGLL